MPAMCSLLPRGGRKVPVQQHGPVRMGDCNGGPVGGRRTEGGSGNRGKAAARFQLGKEWAW